MVTTTQPDLAPPDLQRTPSSPPGLLTGWLVGVVGAVVGLLPWLLTGARLPLQNLWERQTLPADMPRALLPISQYGVSTIAALLIAGGVVAALLLRLPRRMRAPGGRAVAGACVGLFTAHVTAILQSFAVLRDGLGLQGVEADSRAALYWVGMLVGTVVAAFAAQVALWLLTRRSVTAAALGLVLVAVPLASWVGVWSVSVSGPSGPPTVTGEVVRWLPAVGVAVALTWCGLSSAGRVAVWVVAAVVLVLVPPAITAVTSGLGSRVLQGNPSETVAVMREVFWAAIGTGLYPAVAGLAAALLLTALRSLTGRGAAH